MNKQDIYTEIEKLNHELGNKIPASIISSVIVKPTFINIVLSLSKDEYHNLYASIKQYQSRLQSLFEQQKVTIVASGSSNQKNNIVGVKNLIAVLSGKGGVGKSTVSYNIAYSLKQMGFKVGIVDLDVYGPSLHKITGIKENLRLDDKKRMFLPHMHQNMKLSSIGFIAKDQDAMIWRGPMATKALTQLLSVVKWNYDNNELDYLIADLPPGTGDVHISLVKKYNVTGAVVVTTPQELALIDVNRAISMLKTTEIAIIGLVENMSYFHDKANNVKHFLFGNEDISKYAKKNKIKLLGQIPLDTNLNKYDSYHKPEYMYCRQYFLNIAEQILRQK